MRSRILLVIALAACDLSAQTLDQNQLGMWDRSTEYTRRGLLGTSGGQVSQKHQWGVVGGLTQLSFMQYAVQDQQVATQEPFDVGLTGIDSLGLPDYANTRFYATNIRLPNGNPGIRAFLVTHSLNSSSNVVQLPSDGSGFHHCWRLSPAPNWVTDGVSIHTSDGGAYSGNELCFNSSQHAEIPRTEGSKVLQRLGWSEVPNTSPRAVSFDVAWRLDVGSPRATLEGGTANSVYNCPGWGANLGYAGHDPDFANVGRKTPPRFDDFSWSVEAGPSHANGIAVLFHSRALAPGVGVSVPGWSGTLMLDFTDPLFGLVQTGPLSFMGRGSFGLKLGPGTSQLRQIVSRLPMWISQGLVLKSSPSGWIGEFTNVFSMRPRKQFASGFQTAGLSARSPLTITKQAQDTMLYLRNDGPGRVDVKQFAGQNPLPGAWSVNERTAMRIPLAATATRIVVSTKVDKPTSLHSGVEVTYARNY